MTRCVLSRAGRRALMAGVLLAAGLLGGPAAVLAQRPPDHRVFPADALRGDLSFTSATEVQLGGQAERLAPGARIRGEDNQLLLSASLVGQRLSVHYTRERMSGLLLDIWVLRSVERNNRPWPTNPQDAQTWTFDPAAQTWKKP